MSGTAMMTDLHPVGDPKLSKKHWTLSWSVASFQSRPEASAKPEASALAADIVRVANCLSWKTSGSAGMTLRDRSSAGQRLEWRNARFLLPGSFGGPNAAPCTRD